MKVVPSITFFTYKPQPGNFWVSFFFFFWMNELWKQLLKYMKSQVAVCESTFFFYSKLTCIKEPPAFKDHFYPVTWLVATDLTALSSSGLSRSLEMLTHLNRLMVGKRGDKHSSVVWCLFQVLEIAVSFPAKDVNMVLLIFSHLLVLLILCAVSTGLE